MNTRILNILKETGALLEGHFLLSSGMHSQQYVQCAQALRFPWHAEQVIKIICAKVSDLQIDLVVGPAMGGIITSYEMGRQLNVETIFTERVDSIVTFKRGFKVKKGANILISEDVITTGKSTLEVKNLVSGLGGNVLGVACVVDRRPQHEDLGMPVFSGIQLDIKIYDAKNCPLCQQGSKPVKPGSREFLS